jgi:haloalkane dehalogenase
MPDPDTVFRTPDERFENLPGFPYEPHYREWRGMRLAHIDEGEGPPIVMLHGEPTWSFLYRKVMEPLLYGGYRCIAPDLPGFGRSDKPTEEDWYSYEEHTASIVSLLEELDLQDITLVMQDWGGPIGLRVATMELPERVIPSPLV